MAERRHRLRVLGLWLALVLAAFAYIATHLKFSYDLGLFLPQPQTVAQQVLVERLGDSPGSRYVLLAMPNDEARILELIPRLMALDSIENVLSDLNTEFPDQVPEPVWSHRYLLADMDWTAEGLQTALRQRLSELALGSDTAFEAMLRHDPTLTALGILEDLSAGREGAWLTPQDQRVLVAVTASPAFDLSAQQQAVDDLRTTVGELFPAAENTEISGAGVFGVELRQTIQSEASWRSLMATGLLIAVLLLAYRSARVIWLSALPLLSALAAGLLGVSLVFGEVHGITLAFGITLMGVAIDYPLHLLSHARHKPAETALGAIWPTLRLSAASTALAYLALTLGGARGMAQLGLFSALGVAGALLCTRWVVPVLVWSHPPIIDPRSDAHRTPGLVDRKWLWPILILLAILIPSWMGLTRDWWNNDLSALSPIPPQKLLRDAELRKTVGAPSMRHQIVLRDSSLESLLQRSEHLNDILEGARSEGLMGNFSNISLLLPSEARQRQRQNRIPTEADLRQRLASATRPLPFTDMAFEGFITDSIANRTSPPIGPDSYSGTPLEDVLVQFLISPVPGDTEDWTGLVSLEDDFDPQELKTSLEDSMPEAVLVDYRSASEALVADYRHRTTGVLAGVLVLILALLLWQVHWKRGLVCIGMVVLSLLCTATLLRAVGGPLNLYHMMGLLLVAGIGLDYALFLSKNDRDQSDTRHAVMTCAASTVAAFGVLAFSAIPALNSLGRSVAIGVLICVLAAWLTPSLLAKRQPNPG